MGPAFRWVAGLFSRRAARKEGERRAERRMADRAARQARESAEARRELRDEFARRDRESQEARARGEVSTPDERLDDFGKRISVGRRKK